MLFVKIIEYTGCHLANKQSKYFNLTIISYSHSIGDRSRAFLVLVLCSGVPRRDFTCLTGDGRSVIAEQSSHN